MLRCDLGGYFFSAIVGRLFDRGGGQLNLVCGKVAVGLALGTATLSSPAGAQEARKLDFGVQAQVEHNSNVARSSKAEADLRGVSRADTLFTPSATIDLVVPVGRQSVFARGGVGYAFYDKNTQLNRERIDLSSGVSSRFGPCVPNIMIGYTRGLNDYDDPTLGENVENVRETKTLSGGVNCTRPTGIGLVLSASKDWIDNSTPFLKTSDAERSSAMVGLTYGRPALGTLTVFGSRDQTTYPNRIFDDGYDMTAIGLTFQRQLGARIEGTATVSRNLVDSHAPSFLGGGNEQSTTAYSGSLTYRASSRLRFIGSFDRAVTPTSSVGSNYDVSESYRLSSTYEVGSRIVLNAGVRRVKRDAETPVVLPLVQLTDSTVDSVFGSVRYKQSDRLSFVLSAGHEVRTANAPQFEYTNNRIGISADVSF